MPTTASWHSLHQSPRSRPERGSSLTWMAIRSPRSNCRFSASQSSPLNFYTDLWAWDGTVWTQITTPHSYPAVGGCAYDSVHAQVVVVTPQNSFFSGSTQTWLYDGTDWTFTEGGFARWETQTEAENPSANALRWGTLYNYRFDVQAPPVSGELMLELFGAGTPADVTAYELPVPGLRTGDTNGDGIADLNDLATLLATFGLCDGDPNFEAAADFDRDGCITLSDLALLLSVFGQ